ncbi:hypothetical protein FF38_07468 [Lucilia cuprina]|uniref:Uncharacterized protein n=1 Tax=Lucilia cuprina TaxID=7375 RepID=A0A0L0CE02_LUCCU|nr:hypothetical protein FF38_07468 [Lucilia cuprina]
MYEDNKNKDFFDSQNKKNLVSDNNYPSLRISLNKYCLKKTSIFFCSGVCTIFDIVLLVKKEKSERHNAAYGTPHVSDEDDRGNWMTTKSFWRPHLAHPKWLLKFKVPIETAYRLRMVCKLIKCVDEFSNEFLGKCITKIRDARLGIRLKLNPAEEIIMRPCARVGLGKMTSEAPKMLESLKLVEFGAV